MYQFGAINIQDAIDALSKSKRTVQRRLMELVEKGILKIERQGPTTKYVLISEKEKHSSKLR